MDYSSTNDEIEEWIDFGQGLPNVSISEIEIHYASKKIRVAKYGRGVLESELYGNAPLPTISSNKSDVLCPEENATLVANPWETASKNLNYKWFINGTEIINEYDSSINVTKGGNYTVEVTDSEGKSGISNPLRIKEDVCVGVYENSLEDVSISPNPTKGY